MKKTTVDVPVSLDIATAKSGKRALHAQNNVMSQLSQQYASLSTDTIARWNLANNQVQTPDNPQNNAVRGANGWTAFYSCNVALMGANQPIVHTPSPVIVPVNLAPLIATITVTGGNPAIVLSPDGPEYPDGPLLSVWATPATPLGNGNAAPATWRAKAYFPIGTLSGGLSSSGADVTSLYLSVFPSVPAACKIGFKLMAINPGGWHSEAAYTFGLTPMLSLSASAQGDTELKLASGG